jgi:error-prone DNA polymerase
MYVEFHSRSAFSFLEGSTLPEDLISVCAARGLPAMALLDRDGLYGSPRFYLAAKKIGLKAHIGAEVSCESFSPQRHPSTSLRAGSDTEKIKNKENLETENPDHLKTCHSERSEESAFSRRTAPPPTHLQSEIKNQKSSDSSVPLCLCGEFKLPLLVASRAGYQNLCQLITRMKLRAQRKEEGAVLEHELEQHAPGLICLTGGDEGPLAAALKKGGPAEARRAVDRLTSIFGRNNVYVELATSIAKKKPATASPSKSPATCIFRCSPPTVSATPPRTIARCAMSSPPSATNAR